MVSGLVRVAGPGQAQVVLVRWVPGVGLAPHQEPVAVQVPVVWGQHQAAGQEPGVWVLVVPVQAHEPAELPVLVLVVMVLVLLLVLAAVGGTDKTNGAGYKQSPQR